MYTTRSLLNNYITPQCQFICSALLSEFVDFTQNFEKNTCVAIYIHSNEIHNVVALIKCLLVLKCQLYMFRTVTVHPQELLCRYCMCRLWYVLIRPAGTTLYQREVPDSVVLKAYHTLHIQYLQRSS